MILLPCQSFSITYVDYANYQFAGETGLLSMGLGKNLERYSIGGMYGVLPSGMSGTHTIETITLRQTYSFYDWKRFTAHVGLNIFHVLGLVYQTSKYGESPKSYYPIGSIRGLLNLGGSIQLDKSNTNAFYFEGGLNDIWIVNSLTNQDAINPTEHISLGLGYKRNF